MRDGGGLRPSDCVLAVVVPAMLIAQVASGNVGGPLWVAIVGGLALGLCMLFRGRHPWAVLAAVFAIVLATSLLGLSQEGLYGAIVAGFVAVYGVAGGVGLPQALLAMAYGLAMTFGAVYRTGIWKSFLAVFVLGGAVVIGQAVGAHRAIADRLQRAMEELAARRQDAVNSAVAAERVQIARELHDVIAHSVSVMVIQAAAAEEVLEIDPARARKPLSSVQTAGRQALAELRRLLGVLRADAAPPENLFPQPGLGDLETLVGTIRSAGLTVHLDVDGRPSTLPAGVDLAAYRIVQEALTNVLKHANANNADVRVSYRADRVELEVTDDGHGDGGRGEASGQGLIGMRERVAAYGGEFEAGPQAEGGYKVAARLDVTNN